MKKLLYTLLLFILTIPAFTQNAGITVIAPNGGEICQYGTTHLITWTDNICQNVRIELWKGGIFYSMIALSAPSTRSYPWAITNSITPGNNYKVKIIGLAINASTVPIIYDISDNYFSIVGITSSNTDALSLQNPRNVLIYNITSTDCGPCSCMDSIFHHVIMPAYPNTIVVALHGPGSHFNTYQGDSARKYFHALYEPSGFIDGLGYDVPYFFIIDSVASRYIHSADAPVQIEVNSKTWNPGTRMIDMSLTMTNIGVNDISGLYQINVIVTEDNIKETHRTMHGCSTPDVPGLPFRNNYFNSWVTRKMVYWSRGDSLIGPQWYSQQSITRSCTFSIDTGWVPENCNIIVMVFKNADSLYKAPVQQAFRQSLTGGAGAGEPKALQDAVIRIYPNPAQGITNIHFSTDGSGVCKLSLYDMSGHEIAILVDGILNKGIYNVELNSGNYPPGNYICILQSPSGKYQYKFIIR